ncbi:hypothetical protein OF83DRAFT_356740 [Amylostereum chailletii]|nr:hypothetical protein OF83DRAFT_356740 [Amylostereum chailletii]
MRTVSGQARSSDHGVARQLQKFTPGFHGRYEKNSAIRHRRTNQDYKGEDMNVARKLTRHARRKEKVYDFAIS